MKRLRRGRGGERRRGGQIGIASTAAGAGRDGRGGGRGMSNVRGRPGKVMEVRGNWGIETGGVARTGRGDIYIYIIYNI